MSTIGSTGSTSYLSSTSGAQSIQSPVNSSPDPDGDGDGGGGGKVHKSHRGGGQLAQQLMQALQSLGVSMPQQNSATTASTGTSAATGSDGDSNGSSSTGSSIKQDLKQVMHSLFQAIKSEKGSGTDPKTNFATGLSDLISQVSSGSAPSDLQDAFSKLMADLQQTGASSSGTSASSTTGAAAKAQPTLQAFLSQLQQNIGYGKSNLDATGNVVATHA